MKYQSGASNQASEHKMSAAGLSLTSILATIILASITHAYEFGYRAFVAGSVVILLLCGMNILYRRTTNRVFLVFYGLFNAWVIIGLGLLNGFWNHGMKVFLYYLHNGSLPPFLAKLFMTPHTGSPLFEGVGILTFVMSMFAAYYGFKFMREGR